MKKRYLWWFLGLAWCIFIFIKSNKPANESAEESMMVVRYANQFLANTFGAGKVEITDHIVRKTAHLTEYFILGFILFKAFFNIERLSRTFWLATLSSMAYAVSDEIHQYFVPGRAMMFMDVLIDSAGILLATSLLFLRKRQSRHFT